MFSFDIQRFSSYVVYVDPASSSLSVTKDGVASEITGTVSINGTISWGGQKYSLDEYEAVVTLSGVSLASGDKISLIPLSTDYNIALYLNLPSGNYTLNSEKVEITGNNVLLEMNAFYDSNILEYENVFFLGNSSFTYNGSTIANLSSANSAITYNKMTIGKMSSVSTTTPEICVNTSNRSYNRVTVCNGTEITNAKSGQKFKIDVDDDVGSSFTFKINGVTFNYDEGCDDMKIEITSSGMKIYDEDGKNLVHTYKSSSGNTIITMNSSTETITESGTKNYVLDSSHEGIFWANEGVVTINAKSITDDILIIGNENSNSIIGGSGKNSLWGGGTGDNTLTGGSSQDQFCYTGGGNDVVTNFSSGSGTNNDVVVLLEGSYSGITRNGKTVSFNTTDGHSMKLNTNSSSGDSVILYSADGDNVYGAKIGGSSDKSLTYTSDANYYQLNGGGTLNVSTGGNTVVLNGNFVGINNIEATGSGSNILVGNGNSNSIVGGSGNSSLWGSAANANDTLVGGNGTDMFWYGRGEGNDVIKNSTEKDSVNFYNLKLSDISSIDYTSKSVAISFNSGQKVTVNDSGGTSAVMMFEGGQRWKYNHSSGNWQQG